MAGCAESRPAPVPPAVSEVVTELLAAVDPTVKPAFQAATCGSVMDDPDASNVVVWADATLPSGSATKLRAKAVKLGWQPQEAAGFDVFLIGPYKTRVALRGDKVRAEQAECSVAERGQELAVDVRPDLSDAQAAAVSRSFKPAVVAADDVYSALRQEKPFKTYPASGDVRDAPGATLSTCPQKPAGVSWYAASSTHLPIGMDSAAAKAAVAAALGADWQVDKRPAQPDYLKARQGNGTELTMTFKAGGQIDLTLENKACVPVR
ncbi:hypothetical protein Acsp05_12890 [Actinokineospora sp. NBRC 105648]|nr:hypothetical protein Acsp05_12890 [Actinokineospora sp. NBRC 105648]